MKRVAQEVRQDWDRWKWRRFAFRIYILYAIAFGGFMAYMVLAPIIGMLLPR